MAEDREGLLEHYARMRRDLLAAIDGLSEEQLSETTLDGWSVAQHLVHLAVWDELRSVEIERISAGFDSAWKSSNEQGDEYNRLTFALRGAFSVAQARWEIASSHERVLAALRTATERGLTGELYGEAGLPSDHEMAHTDWIRRWRAERGY